MLLIPGVLLQFELRSKLTQKDRSLTGTMTLQRLPLFTMTTRDTDSGILAHNPLGPQPWRRVRDELWLSENKALRSPTSNLIWTLGEGGI
ncbi:hypothetical protein QC764_0042550 [Podospora pseudoanserina]|uniref:Uncharacterized protein n=2 Tax=Podospora TaxID=5144 RepID=A0ABR0IIH3_9PEZI|nr:hypothetical protein QC764_0042550 [Podospora pseudoanserina]